MDWKTLTDTYNKDGIALVLGAGVSYDSNIPTWENLLKKMVKKYIDPEDDGLFDALKNGGMSYPAIASLIEEHCNSHDHFIRAMRETLYADFPFQGVRFNKENHSDFVRFVRKGLVPSKFRRDDLTYKANPTLRSVGTLCLVRGINEDKRRYFGNPKIHAVGTLNMDALLQTYIHTLSAKHLMRTVEQSSAKSYPGQLNLYHMHGYLHYAKGAPNSSRNIMEGIVLTEQDYYDFFNQPNRIFNYTFLYLLREYSCLFIGLSMQDENIRRMLHYSVLERLLAISNKMNMPLDVLKRKLTTSDLKEEIAKQVGRHYAILPCNKLSGQAKEAWARTLLALGVNILWIDDFGEIPRRLKLLYESDPKQKDMWDSVYGRD